MSARKRKCFVYIMAMYPEPECLPLITEGDIGWRKVGISADPKKRRIDIQTSSPFLVRLEGVVSVPDREIGRIVESVSHAVLANHFQCRGEWCHASHSEIEAIVLAAAKRASDEAKLVFSWYEFVKENADMWKRVYSRDLRHPSPHRLDPTGAHAFDLSTKH